MRFPPAASVFIFIPAHLVAAGEDPFTRVAVPLLEQYCYSCHGPEKQKGGIEFHTIRTTTDAIRQHGLLAKSMEQVLNEDMPPDTARRQPQTSEREALAAELESIVLRVARGDVPRMAGRTTARRLNRTEYNNTVRDLFGVDFQPGRDFPADPSGGEGFDNTADALILSPALLEKYLEAARKVVDALYARPDLRKKVIFNQPDGKDAPEKFARQVLVFHASLAYRQRVDDEAIEPLLGMVATGLKNGLAYEEAIRPALVAMLVSPRFLFRIEKDRPGEKEWAVDEFELATRLSYFLWSSMPDRALFQAASQGKLDDAETFTAQVERMLDDPRSEALARHFAGQWLGFEAIREQANPDEKRFPGFTRPVRVAMYREAVEFFHGLVREDLPITDIIASDYTYLNETLARHYGIAGVTGEPMRKVKLSDANRGGVIGMGAILTSTSLPLRTSPVKRGVWVLEALLGDPPPPPPPDAGQLPADDKSTEGLTLRQQLDVHRERPDCRGCHQRIDPIGFGLEGFDPVGRWRVEVHGRPVDSLAQLPDGRKFSTPAELKGILMESKDKFARNFCRKLLSYALGRELDYYDEPTVAELAAVARENEYRIRPVLHALVRTATFRNRSAPQ